MQQANYKYHISKTADERHVRTAGIHLKLDISTLSASLLFQHQPSKHFSLSRYQNAAPRQNKFQA